MTNPPGAMPPLPDLRQFHNSVDGVIELVMKRYGQACAEAAAALLIARVAELQAERDRFERNRDMWKGQCERQAEKLTVFHATVPALEIDAARYRMVRRGQHWSVIDGIGETLRADELDEQVDAAIAARKEQQP